MSSARQNYLKKFKSSLRSYAKKGWDISTINPDTLSTSILRKGAQAYITGKATKISEVTGKTITYSPYRARQEGAAKAKQTVAKKSEDSITYRFKRQAQQEMALSKARLSQAEKRYFKAKADKITTDLKYKGKLSAAKSKAQLEFDKKENKLAEAEREYLSKQKYYLEMYVPTSFEYKKHKEELEKYRQEKEYEEYYATAQWSSPKPETPVKSPEEIEAEKRGIPHNVYLAKKESEKVLELIDSGKYIRQEIGKKFEGKAIIVDAKTGELVATVDDNALGERSSYYDFVDRDKFLQDYEELPSKNLESKSTTSGNSYDSSDDGYYDNYYNDYDYEYYGEYDEETLSQFFDSLPQKMRYHAYNNIEDIPDIMSKDATIDEMENMLDNMLSYNSENDEILSYLKTIKDEQIEEEGREEFFKRIRTRFSYIQTSMYIVIHTSDDDSIVEYASQIIAVIKDVPQVPDYIQDELREMCPKHEKRSHHKKK